MKMIKIISLLTLLLSISLFGCKKKCDLPKDSISGEIKGEFVVYAGEIAQTNSGRIIRAEIESPEILISSDEGVTKVPVNYGQYSILTYPTYTSCNTSFDRNVKIDDVNSIVTYTIIMEECNKCEYKVNTQNYAVIRAIPSNYQVFYDVKVK
jgi:hypothetical protein